MNKVKCPKCGSEQIIAIEERPNEHDYDVSLLRLRELPLKAKSVYVGVRYRDGMNAIARCLNDKCEARYLIFRRFDSNNWTVEVPSPCVEKIGEGIPSSVDEAYRQARVCLVVGCPDASIAMCRASLDRMTKDKNAEGNTLKARLDDLVKKAILKPSVLTEVVNIREFGNAALHDLLVGEIKSEDAEIICEFTKGVLYDVYVTPELARRAEERRKTIQKEKGKGG